MPSPHCPPISLSLRSVQASRPWSKPGSRGALRKDEVSRCCLRPAEWASHMERSSHLCFNTTEVVFMKSEVGRGLGDSLHLHGKSVGSREVASQPQAQDSQGPLQRGRGRQEVVLRPEVWAAKLEGETHSTPYRYWVLSHPYPRRHPQVPFSPMSTATSICVCPMHPPLQAPSAVRCPAPQLSSHWSHPFPQVLGQAASIPRDSRERGVGANPLGMGAGVSCAFFPRDLKSPGFQGEV